MVRVLTVNYALPEKIKGGEQGWAAQPSKYFSLILSFLLVLNPNSWTCVKLWFLRAIAMFFSPRGLGFMGLLEILYF